ncbi:flippase [Candidatus Woesearchaeota archaeon]|nr:flippase [Candidatus Woesearchaeota archaeon]
MEYTQRAVRGAVIVFILSLGAAVLGYLVRLVLARNFSSADYGLFYAGISLFGLFALFKELGMNQAIVKFIPEYLHDKRWDKIKGLLVAVFSFQFMTSGIVSLAFIAAADWLAEVYFRTPAAAPIIRVLAIVFWLFPVDNVFRYAFQGFQKMLLFASVECIRMLIVVLSLLALIPFLGSIMAAPYAYLISYAVLPLLFLPFLWRLFPDFFSTKMLLDKAFLGDIFRFSLPVMVGLVGGIIFSYTDTAVLTYFRSLEEVALYQSAQPTANLLLYITYALSAVILPLSSELWAKKQAGKLQAGIHALYKYAMIGIIPLSLTAAVFASPILRILFGSGYIGGSIVLQILSFGAIFYTIGYVNGNILSGIGKPGINTTIVVGASLFNLVSNIMIIPFFGIAGASFTTLLSYIIILVLTSRKVNEHVHFETPWLDWGKTAGAGAVFAGVMIGMKALLHANVLIEMLIGGVLASCAYLGVLIVLRVLGPYDIRVVKEMVRRGIGQGK